MKKLDLNAYGVSEMNVAEMRETEGGICGASLLIGFIVVIVISLVEGWI